MGRRPAPVVRGHLEWSPADGPVAGVVRIVQGGYLAGYWDQREGRFIYSRSTVTPAVAVDRPFATL